VLSWVGLTSGRPHLVGAVAGPGVLVVVVLPVPLLDNDVRLARLAIDVPILRDEDPIAVCREGEAGVDGAVGIAGLGLAVTRFRPGLRTVAHLVDPGGRIVRIVKLEPI